MCKQFVEDVTTKTRYNNYLEVVDVIMEYSNNYGKGTHENNFYDWIMIIPINLSVATNGFFEAFLNVSHLKRRRGIHEVTAVALYILWPMPYTVENSQTYLSTKSSPHGV